MKNQTMIPPRPPRLFTRSALRELDHRAVAEFHIPLLLLMENAGRGVADAASRMLAATTEPATILILAGPGNNGADALVAARHLAEAGLAPQVRTLFETDAPCLHTNAALSQHLQIAHSLGLATHLGTAHMLAALTATQDSSHPLLIINGLFGTGLTRPLTGPARAAVELVNHHSRPPTQQILAIDIPSGLDADTGLPLTAASPPPLLPHLPASPPAPPKPSPSAASNAAT